MRKRILKIILCPVILLARLILWCRCLRHFAGGFRYRAERIALWHPGR